MANQSHEPKKIKDLLEFLYLKHGLTVKDNDTSIRAEKYDRLVTEYNTKVNGNYTKKVLKKYFDNQKEIKKRIQNRNATPTPDDAIAEKEALSVESNEILHSDSLNSEE